MTLQERINEILEKYNKNVKYHVYRFDDYDKVNFYDICILYVWENQTIYHYYMDLNKQPKEFILCDQYNVYDFFINKNNENEYNTSENEFILYK